MMISMKKKSGSRKGKPVTEQMDCVNSYFNTLPLDLFELPTTIDEAKQAPVLTQTQEQSAWYFNRLNQLSKKTLSAKDELHLAEAAKKGSASARKTLVESNLRLVVYIAKSFLRQGADFMDLVQAGNYGLMKAVDKFDVSRGNRFSTYAAWWIKQAVLQCFSEHDRLIRLPGHVVTQINKVRHAVDRLNREQDKLPSLEDVSKSVNLPPKKVEELIQLFNKPLSIEQLQPTSSQEQEENNAPLQLRDERYHPERLMISEYRKQLLQQAFVSQLTDTEQNILTQRFGLEWVRIEEENTSDNLKVTLETLGEALGVSRECVRQTEKKALAKLKQCALLLHIMD
jgi:RNA polymerase primary sigma factor